MESKPHVIVIGAGLAGLEAARSLHNININVSIIEKEKFIGGHIRKWHKVFPYFRDAAEIIKPYQNNHTINIYTEHNIINVRNERNKFKLFTDKNRVFDADAILITTGFSLFDARKKEEYGYGIYKNVLTNLDLEQLFAQSWTKIQNEPYSFAFIHCVGSRDRKTGNIYCSKVCCATAIKQAIEIRQLFSMSKVYCFYMDLRMYDKHFEQLFSTAQEKYGIQFIRGRVSEISENENNRLLLKFEDTLLSQQMKMTFDYVVLMAGMTNSNDNNLICKVFNLHCNDDGFIEVKENQTFENLTTVEGVFVAGAATGPKTITETIQDARAAAIHIYEYLAKSKK